MKRSVTKSYRLSPESARTLRRLAKEAGTSEAAVIRHGLELVERMLRPRRQR